MCGETCVDLVDLITLGDGYLCLWSHISKPDVSPSCGTRRLGQEEVQGWRLQEGCMAMCSICQGAGTRLETQISSHRLGLVCAMQSFGAGADWEPGTALL